MAGTEHPRLGREQRKDLIEALGRVYPNYDDLEYFLDLELDQRLADFSAAGPLPLVIRRVVERAQEQGWLADLVVAAAAEAAPHSPLQRLAAALTPDVAPARVAGDVASYDMQDHERQFRVALHDATTSLIGLAVPTADEMFLSYLHRRLVGVARGELSVPLTLDPRHGGVGSVTYKLRQFHQRLDHQATVTPIWAARIPDAGSLITELWAGLGAGPTDWAHRLVVVFAVDAEVLDTLPPGISRLPAPSSHPEQLRSHVISWVDELVAGLPDWPHERSRRLVDAIYQPVVDVEEELRLFTLYDELERRLRALCEDFAAAVAALDAA